MGVANRIQSVLQQEGLRHVLRKSITSVLRKLDLAEDLWSEQLRASRKIDQMFDSTIAYGPLKGFRFAGDSWWSATDRASMILGLYEKEVLDWMTGVAKDHDILVDIGAADGYYAVGAVSSGLFSRSYCFEASKSGQEVIATTAELNSVADRVTIFGKATSESFDAIPEEARPRCAILCDIEGAEFEILDEVFLKAFARSPWLIEIHDRISDDAPRRYAEFMSRCAGLFDLTELNHYRLTPVGLSACCSIY
jgi:hypothetical protein